MRSWTLTFIAAALLVGSQAQQAGFNVNGMVDTLLSRAEDHILPSIDIPDVSVSELFKVLFFNVKASLDVSKGWLLGPKSVRRFDDSKLTMEDQYTFSVDIPVGVNEINFGYNYKTKVAGISGPRGNFTATVGATAVTVRASVTIYDEFCYAKFESLDLTQLGNVTVSATGLGVANSIYSKMLTKFAESQRDKVQAQIAEDFEEATKWTFDCNSYLPPVLRPCRDCANDPKPMRSVNSTQALFPTVTHIFM
ncbi:uncharacterized protein LOC113218437 [Frankliniella occidentalis]|uniref:Uncharacterized protein LOC113218437 n=1 Tax=Frankliniella occidentalis TaxID=133901 RepID=A0A6J1TVF2_FRAOC|nr:uncharacterized protein LOC113218437 [Frankliniella occidentalis]